MSGVNHQSIRLRYESMPRISHMEGIMTNILSRLPVKNLGVCKAVSKNWLRLISEPHFVNIQLNRARENLKYAILPYFWRSRLSLVEGNGWITQNIYLSNFVNASTFELFCFSNGLICSVSHDFSSRNEINVCIFNPVTRDNVIIPKGTPSKGTPFVGIGFDPDNNNFKVFRFFMDLSQDDKKYQCEVYTSGSPWRRISEDMEPPFYDQFNTSCARYASIDGHMYWFARSTVDGLPIGIISVDMDDNFTRIDVPSKLGPSSFLVELGGSLAVVHVNYRATLKRSKQWFVEVFKLRHGEWHLDAKVDLNLRSFLCFESVTARNKDIFFLIRVDNGYFRYLVFNLAKGTMRSLHLHDQFDGNSPLAFTYAESLLKCGGGA